MAFHRHHHRKGERDLITVGITSGNLERLRHGPIPFPVGPLNCVLRLDSHPLPHPGWLAVTLSDADLKALVAEGLVEFSGASVGVVCVFGRTPRIAGEAVQKVLGPDVRFVAAAEVA